MQDANGRLVSDKDVDSWRRLRRLLGWMPGSIRCSNLELARLQQRSDGRQLALVRGRLHQGDLLSHTVAVCKPTLLNVGCRVPGELVWQRVQRASPTSDPIK